MGEQTFPGGHSAANQSGNISMSTSAAAPAVETARAILVRNLDDAAAAWCMILVGVVMPA